MIQITANDLRNPAGYPSTQTTQQEMFRPRESSLYFHPKKTISKIPLASNSSRPHSPTHGRKKAQQPTSKNMKTKKKAMAHVGGRGRGRDFAKRALGELRAADSARNTFRNVFREAVAGTWSKERSYADAMVASAAAARLAARCAKAWVWAAVTPPI